MASAPKTTPDVQIGLRCASFFLMHGAAGGFESLKPVFLSLSFSPAKVGILSGLPCMLGILVNPLVSAICDGYSLHQQLLVVFTITQAVLRLCLLWPGLPSSWLAALIIVYTLLFSPMTAIVDASAMAVLGDRYGTARLFGSIGFGALAFVSGGLVSLSGGPVASANFSYAFALTCALQFVGAICSVRLDFSALKQGGGESKKAAEAEDHPSFLTLLQKVASFRSVLFYTVTFINGGLLGSASFFGMLLQELGASGTLIGAAGSLGPIAEVVFFQISGMLLKRWGLSGCIIAAQAAFMFRFLWYAALPRNLEFVQGRLEISRELSLWGSLVSELLHGLCFAVSWTATLKFAKDIAPPGLQASSISLVSTIMFGLGLGAGASGIGLLIAAVGTQRAFGAAAVCAAVNVGLALLGLVCYGPEWSHPRRESSNHKKKE